MNVIERFGIVILLLFGIENDMVVAQSWEKVDLDTLPVSNMIYDLDYSMQTNKVVFIGSEGEPPDRVYYLITTKPAIQDWKVNELPQSRISLNDLSVSRNGTVTVATSTNIYYSRDDGASWDSLLFHPNLIEATSLVSYANDGVLISSGQGLFHSNPIGSPVEFYSSKFDDNAVYGAFSDQSVVAVSYDFNLAFSSDAGVSWSDINNQSLVGKSIQFNTKHAILTYYGLGDSVNRLYLYDLSTTKTTALKVPGGLIENTWDTEDKLFFSTYDLFKYPKGVGVSYYDYKTEALVGLNVSQLSIDTVFSGSLIVVSTGHLFMGTNKGLYRTTEPVVTSTGSIAGASTYEVSAYPNPVSSGGSISLTYSISHATSLNLVVQDILGRTVRHSFLGRIAPGKHTKSISTAGLEPGMYFYSLIPGNGKPMNGKMIVR